MAGSGKIAQAANVKQTFLFHHDPSHNDDKMDEIKKEVSLIHPSVRPAIEGKKFSSRILLSQFSFFPLSKERSNSTTAFLFDNHFFWFSMEKNRAT